MGLTKQEFLKLYPALEPWMPEEPTEQMELALQAMQELEQLELFTDAEGGEE